MSNCRYRAWSVEEVMNDEDMELDAVDYSVMALLVLVFVILVLMSVFG